MNILFNKNILLGITGSIAAYKAADITSKLKKEGCNIKIVMTKSSESFVTETTLESLSSNPVFTEEDKDGLVTKFTHLKHTYKMLLKDTVNTIKSLSILI